MFKNDVFWGGCLLALIPIVIGGMFYYFGSYIVSGFNWFFELIVPNIDLLEKLKPNIEENTLSIKEIGAVLDNT